VTVGGGLDVHELLTFLSNDNLPISTISIVVSDATQERQESFLDRFEMKKWSIRFVAIRPF
jgi:hypothetical protein